MLVKRLAISMVLLGVAFGFFAGTEARAVDILYIYANTAAMQPSDDLIKNFMEQLGYTVTYLDDNTAQADMQTACRAAKLVFISETVASQQVRYKVTNMPVPMIISEMYAWDEMGLMAVAGTSPNVVTPTIDIVASNHPMAAGLKGTVTLFSDITGPLGAVRMANGAAGSAATVIARAKLADNVTYDVIYIYPKGAALPAVPTDTPPSPQIAADLRICFGLDAQGYLVWNRNAFSLLEAAIRYAIGDPQGAVDVSRDAVLSWKRATDAVAYDVYFGTSRDDIMNASRTSPMGLLRSQGQEPNTFDPPGLLEYGKTYYWRVDNVMSNGSIVKGYLWILTAETYASAMKSSAILKATASSTLNADTAPGKTIDGTGLDSKDLHSTASNGMWISGGGGSPEWIQYEFDRVYKLDQMWVWNANQADELTNGCGAKEVGIEVSTDGITWTALAGVPEFARATGAEGYAHNTTVNFGRVLAKYVRLTMKSNWSGGALYGLSEVRFFYVPLMAYSPMPATGATGVALDSVLNWRSGHEADRHELTIGIDKDAVVNGTAPAKTLADNACPLADVVTPEYGRTYYWKVNEVNDVESPKAWAGDVWSFSTNDHITVDDFEAYDDTCNRIFYDWIDGAGRWEVPECGLTAISGNGSGALVGNPQAPFAEKTNIHAGKQSMPMEYNNSFGPFYSEARREWAAPQTWGKAGGGINALTVFFRGIPTAFQESPAGVFTMSGMGSDIFKTSDQFRFAYKSLSGNGTIVARVDNLVDTNVWSLAGVMIRESLEAGSRYAGVFLSSVNGVRFRVRPTADANAVSDTTVATDEQKALKEPVWIKLERTGAEFKAYYSLDGNAWTLMVFSPQTVAMSGNVYIGMAVCSHDAAISTSAQFSNVSTTGSVTGTWQPTEIGLVQPTANAPDTFYVAVEDSAGKVKMVTHPNPNAVASGAWERFDVPFSQLAGVDLNGVKKVTIGIGDKAAPKAGGTGKLFIDDLWLTRVAP